MSWCVCVHIYIYIFIYLFNYTLNSSVKSSSSFDRTFADNLGAVLPAPRNVCLMQLLVRNTNNEFGISHRLVWEGIRGRTGDQTRYLARITAHMLIRRQYIYIYIYIFFFFLMQPHVHTKFRGPPSWLWRKCNRLLRLGRPLGTVTLSRWCEGWYIGRWGARRGLMSRSTNYPDHGHHGDPPPTRKIPMVEAGIEPGTSWLVVRSSDH